MTGVVYDTGALLKAERRDRLMWLRHDQILASGRVPVVPAVVLAQAWRGATHALPATTGRDPLRCTSMLLP